MTQGKSSSFKIGSNKLHHVNLTALMQKQFCADQKVGIETQNETVNM